MARFKANPFSAALPIAQACDAILSVHARTEAARHVPPELRSRLAQIGGRFVALAVDELERIADDAAAPTPRRWTAIPEPEPAPCEPVDELDTEPAAPVDETAATTTSEAAPAAGESP